jgi:curved DNA-binding protein CbpA
MPKDTELYDLLGVAPEATDIEYAFHPLSRAFVMGSKLIT